MRNRPVAVLSLWLRLFAALTLLAGLQLARAEEDFLDPEVAFKLAARAVDARTVEVSYTVVPGYYLYREQFKFAAVNATLGEPVLPQGKTKFDETFQKNVETYRDTVRIAIPVQQAAGKFQLLVTNQGCADKGLCYPPQPRGIEVSLAGFGGDGSARLMTADQSLALATAGASSGTAAAAAVTASPAYAADDAAIDGALRSGKFWTVVGVFFVGGLLLSLTPCVLPMLPILSSIIVGHGAQVSRGRGLGLAASYSLGMALVYTAFGVAAGLAGEGLAAALQKPWVLALFAAGLVALSLSMFGVYELQLPARLTGRVSSASQRLPAGRFAGVFAMGGLSALIVSPCVAAPLAGALVYLSQTRDVALGGTALFSLAAGMSVPLLLMGASAGALLPRAGGWMEDVKRFFGVMLLGVALWTVQSILPASLVLALWGALAISAAVMLVAHRHGAVAGWTRSLWRLAAGAVLAVCGLLQLVGAASGGTNPLQPLAQWRGAGGPGTEQGPAFTFVRSVADLDAALQTAKRPVMLDFYADWCVSCKEMERFTFVDPAVRKRMAGALLLKADVTANSADDRALLKRFNLFGPPGTIFFDPQGREIASARIAGFQDATRFLQTLQTAGL
ncbi:protein-disulfide reductase DsbD [Rhizobacter sp. Root404]|uniref:protein-disulfide reductase DsbD n=1 Tax=Rhizobacter sp. Root404 TaxID=1736528 RepID=UPI0006FA22C1|nr:protein-disulfide reductase DsbD [Rhizobacter sp. Root404]KQW33497.1 protein-disulfide reductase [Rhizobacter sp. Root404]